MTEEIYGFAGLFLDGIRAEPTPAAAAGSKGPPDASTADEKTLLKDLLDKRLRQERRGAMTDKQLKRRGVRTAQMNFRCTPQFQATAKGLAAHMGVSIADAMEEAVQLLATAKDFEGKRGDA